MTNIFQSLDFWIFCEYFISYYMFGIQLALLNYNTTPDPHTHSPLYSLFLRYLLTTTPADWLRLFLVQSVVLRKKKSFSLVLNICTAARTPIDKSGRLLKRSARARRIAPDKKWRPQQGSIYRKEFWQDRRELDNCDECHMTGLAKIEK